jgi:hypothetical protein
VRPAQELALLQVYVRGPSSTSPATRASRTPSSPPSRSRRASRRWRTSGWACRSRTAATSTAPTCSARRRRRSGSSAPSRCSARSRRWGRHLPTAARSRYWTDGYRGPELDLHGIDWLIVGGESGHDHRPMRWTGSATSATRRSAWAPPSSSSSGAAGRRRPAAGCSTGGRGMSCPRAPPPARRCQHMPDESRVPEPITASGWSSYEYELEGDDVLVHAELSMSTRSRWSSATRTRRGHHRAPRPRPRDRAGRPDRAARPLTSGRCRAATGRKGRWHEREQPSRCVRARQPLRPGAGDLSRARRASAGRIRRGWTVRRTAA